MATMKAMVLALGVAAVLAAVVGLSLTLSPNARGGVQAQGASPAVPANVRAENGVEPGQAVVTWDAVDTAAYYRIGWVNMETFWAVQAEGERQWLDVFAFLDVVNRGQTSQTLYELAPGVEYAFIVASVGQRFWRSSRLDRLDLPGYDSGGAAVLSGEYDGDADRARGSGAPTPTPTPRATATATPAPTPTPTITAQTPGQDGAGHWFYPTPTPTAGPTGNVFDPTPTARPTVAAGSGAGGSGAAAPTPTPTAGPVANVLDPTPTARPTATATPAPTPTPTPAPTPTPTPAANSVASDRAALVALYDATSGGSWIHKTNWQGKSLGARYDLANARPLGEWYGVTTNGSGRVTRLDLNWNALFGPIPPNWATSPN